MSEGNSSACMVSLSMLSFERTILKNIICHMCDAFIPSEKKCLESVKNVPIAKEETKRAKGLARITRVETGQQNKMTLSSAL